MLFHLGELGEEGVAQQHLAESAASSWVGVVLHAATAVDLLRWRPAAGPLLRILLCGGFICQKVDDDSHTESLQRAFHQH